MKQAILIPCVAPLDKDLGLLITEDDLETELIAGRGMHDVYQGEVTDTPQQVIVPPHSNNHKHRRTKRHTSRQSSDTGQVRGINQRILSGKSLFMLVSMGEEYWLPPQNQIKLGRLASRG